MTTAYVVSSTIQSNDTTNPPVEVQWYKGENLAVAITAMAQAATEREGHVSKHPDHWGYRVLAVRMTVLHDEPGATPSTDENGA